MAVSLQDFDPSLVRVTKPERTNNVYQSYVFTEDKPGYVFLCAQRVHVNGTTIRSDELAAAVTGVESAIASYLSAHSEAFFDGKRFSLAKMQSSCVSSVSGSVVTTSLHPECQIKDQFGADMTMDQLAQCTATAVVCLSGVTFERAQWKLELTVHQIKAFQAAQLKEWAIAEDPEPPVVPPTETDDDHQDFFN
ncbi:hypothetical protein GGF32_003815 [Allomyces javanicus]|nr:hypothetical protein GGF32_003815 [Allomyces javanicus]